MGVTATAGRDRVRQRLGRLAEPVWNERRVLGGLPLLLPLAVVTLGCLLAVATGTTGGSGRLWQLLSAIPELGLSLSAGACVAIAVLADPDIELQLSAPTRFSRVVVRRIALVLIGHGGLAAALTGLLQLVGAWYPPVDGWGPQLAWLAPALWLAGVGAALGLLTRSRTATVAALGGWWCAQVLFTELLVDNQFARPVLLFVTSLAGGAEFWFQNRILLLVQAALLLGLAVLLARRTERLLGWDE